MSFDLRIELSQESGVEFKLRAGHVDGISTSGSPRGLEQLGTVALGLDKRLDAAQLLDGDRLRCHGSIDLPDNFGLEGTEARGDFRALGLRFRNWTLVVAQHWKLRRHANRPLVFALIELVAGAKVDIGVLLCDF